MAIRDDFTAGEVLAAADLNDTFASKPPFAYGTATPSTTVEGFIWYDENDTPPIVKFWDGSAFENIAAPATAPGLVHIVTTSFTTVSEVIFNNCFSATYDNYMISISGFSSASTPQIRYRFRVATVDASGADYTNQRLEVGGGTVAAGRSTTSNGQLSNFGGTTRTGDTSYFYAPFLAEVSASRNVSACGINGGTILDWVITHSLATSYDGIRIYPDSGTITGTIRIYGLKNS